MEYISVSLQDTYEIAEKIAKELLPGDVVCLDGELGAGKTAFAKGLCKALGVTENVYSPTYTIINTYSGICPIYHIDAYRIEDSGEMYEIGFEDCLAEGICIIEWSVQIADILPKKRLEITITKDYTKNEDYRRINVLKRN